MYKQDYLGNIVALLLWGNNILKKYTYDAFGTPTITDANENVRTESAYGNRFMFTGREWSEVGSRDIDGEGKKRGQSLNLCKRLNR